jgi:hypothetical protein
MAGVYMPENEYQQFQQAMPSRLPSPQDLAAANEGLARLRQRQAALTAAYAPKPQEPRSWLEEGLSLLGRPLSAVSSAVGYGLAGQDPLEGARLGLEGRSPIQGFGDVLERQGVPEMGRVELGPLNFSGRDVLGLGLDFAGDPTSYVGGAIGKGIGLAAGGAAKVAPRAVEMVGRYAPKLRPIEDTIGQISRGGAQRLTANLPGVNKIAGRISPRLATNDPTDLAWYARTMQREEGRKIVDASIMPQFQQGKPFRELGNGYILTRDGRRIGVKEVTSNPGQYFQSNSPEYEWFTRASQVQEEVNGYARSIGAVDYKPIDLPDGGQYFHVEVRNPNGGAQRLWMKKRAGGTPSFTKKRSKMTTDDLLAEGYEVLSPSEALRADLISAYDAVADHQWREAMKARGLAVGTGDVKGLTKGITSTNKLLRYEKKMLGQDALDRQAEIGTQLDQLKAAKAELASLEGIAQPLTKDMLFDPPTAQKLAQLIKRDTVELGSVLSPVAKVGQISRLATTGTDFGAAMIQGLPLLFTRPTSWGKAFVGSLRAMAQPESVAKYAADPENQRIWREIPGMVFGAPEWFEALNTAGVKGVGGQVLRQTLGRFQHSFEAFNIIGKTEMAKALYPTYARAGKLDDLGTFLNQMFGTVSSKAQGVSATQREFEAGFLFFAPRYIRASLGLAADALSDTGLKGWEARRAMASLLVGGMAAYLKFAEEFDQEPILDPTDSRFMTLQVGGDRVGIGSIWTSGGRMLADMIINPGDMAKWEDNALLRFLRSRLPPATSTAFDIINGETYFGEPLEGPGDVLRYGAEKALPFTAASHLLEKPGTELSALPFEMIGARVFPQGYGERRDVIARQQYGAGYADLTPTEMQTVDEGLRAKGLPVRGETAKKREGILGKQAEDLAGLAQGVASGELNKSQYRIARGDVKARLSTRLADLDTEASAGKTPEEQRLLNQRKEARMTDRDLARKRYYDLMNVKDAMGRPDYELAESYLASLPADVQAYIEDLGAERLRSLPPDVAQLERELREARKTLKPYWDIQGEVLQKLGLKDKVDAMSPKELDAFKKSKAWDKVDKLVGERRQALRQKNKAVDAALGEWYGYEPVKKAKSPFAVDFKVPEYKAPNPLSKFM